MVPSVNAFVVLFISFDEKYVADLWIFGDKSWQFKVSSFVEVVDHRNKINIAVEHFQTVLRLVFKFKLQTPYTVNSGVMFAKTHVADVLFLNSGLVCYEWIGS